MAHIIKELPGGDDPYYSLLVSLAPSLCRCGNDAPAHTASFFDCLGANMEPIAQVVPSAKRRPKDARSSDNRSNGHNGNGIGATQDEDLALILESLQTMRDGNFSVRLPVAWTGLKGKIADTFNDIISASERMAFELKRVGQAVGKEGRTRERTSFQQSRGSWGEMQSSINTLVED